MKTKIIYLILVLLIFIFLGWNIKESSGQLTVPVTDYGAINSLGQIINSLNQANDVLGTTLATLSRELEKLNTNIENVLKSQFSQKADEIFTDSLKEEFFFYKLINVESLIQSSVKKSQNEEEIKEALEEARLAGLYNALSQIPSIFICLPPEINFELRSIASLVAFKNLEQDFLPETEIEKAFSQIPPCLEINQDNNTAYRNPKNNFALKQNKQSFLSKVLSKLSSPFRLSQLAQVGDYDNFYNPDYNNPYNFPGGEQFNNPPENNQDYYQNNPPQDNNQTNENQNYQYQTNEPSNTEGQTNQSPPATEGQTNQTPGEQNQLTLPSFSIQPDYTRSSRLIAYEALTKNIENYLQASINLKLLQRQNQIENGWPIESCQNYVVLDGEDKNDKKLICQNWKTEITLEDLKKTRENLLEKEGALLTLNSKNMNIFQKFLQTQNMLTKLNLTATSVSTASDMAGNFPDATETKEIIERTCEKYKGADEDSSVNTSNNQTSASSPEATSTAYVMCLESMSTGMQKMADILKKQFDQAVQLAKEHDKKLKEALDEASTTASSSQECVGLDKIKAEINILQNKLLREKSYLASVFLNSDLENLINNINQEIYKIKNNLAKIREKLIKISQQKTTAGILSTIFPNFSSTLNQINNIINILGSLGININLNIKNFDITGQNKWSQITNQIKDKKIQEIIGIIANFEEQLNRVINVNQKILGYRKSLLDTGITELAKRKDVQETGKIIKKIWEYKQIIRNCEKISNNPTSTAQIKILKSNKVVYNKDLKNTLSYQNRSDSKDKNFIIEISKNKNTSLLANIKNLFKPKKIEISLTNEK